MRKRSQLELKDKSLGYEKSEKNNVQNLDLSQKTAKHFIYFKCVLAPQDVNVFLVTLEISTNKTFSSWTKSDLMKWVSEVQKNEKLAFEISFSQKKRQNNFY